MTWARDPYVLDVVTRDLEEAFDAAGEEGVTVTMPRLALEGLIGMLPYEGEGEFAYRRRQFLEGYASGRWKGRGVRQGVDSGPGEGLSVETVFIADDDIDTL